MSVQQHREHPEHSGTRAPVRPHRMVRRHSGAAGRVVARVPGSAVRDAGRSGRVVTWVGWHLGELVGVGVPAVLAVTVHPWWFAPAGVVAVSWVANEVRVARHRKQARDRATPAGHATTDTEADTEAGTAAHAAAGTAAGTVAGARAGVVGESRKEVGSDGLA